MSEATSNTSTVRASRMSRIAFTLAATDGAARTGTLATPRGDIRTPAFMPVGTAGAVKAVLHRDLREIGARVLLANTYHLMLRPGDDLVAALRGDAAATWNYLESDRLDVMQPLAIE